MTLLTSLIGNSQTTIFEDSFDTYTDFAISGVGAWTLVDLDLRPTYGFEGATFLNSGSPMAFIVFNSTTTTPPLDTAEGNWAARTGTKMMACIAAVPNTTVLKNNDWLISPQVQLGASGNTLSFWMRSADAIYADEEFNVGISTTNTAPGSFTIVTPNEYAAYGPYVEYTVNLDAYQGQNVYIGVNCFSTDQFGFLLDDFKVTTDALSTDDFLASKFAVYPNPANNVVTIANNNNILLDKANITDVNGRTVKSVKLNSAANAEVNISELNAGVYFLNIDSAEGSTTKKIIKN